MHKYIVLLTAILLPLLSLCQKSNEKNTLRSYVEFNGGLAYVEAEFFFPGTSVLLGQTNVSESNFVIEYEIGLALPSIGTAKFGFGKKFNNTIITAGIRPFPFNLYLQSTFLNSQRGYWIASIEANPLPEDHALSFHSYGLVTMGYRLYLSRQ